MDLEISNASLLALNRTLEKRMRKQNSELRRYRRLTRTGQLVPKSPTKRRISRGSMDGEVRREADEGDAEDEECDED